MFLGEQKNRCEQQKSGSSGHTAPRAQVSQAGFFGIMLPTRVCNVCSEPSHDKAEQQDMDTGLPESSSFVYSQSSKVLLALEKKIFLP